MFSGGRALTDNVDFIDREREVAAAFVAARREARPLTAYPGTPPEDLASAYRIQDCALSLDGRTVIGWKVGRINAPADARLGANRLAGPVFAGSVADSTHVDVPTMPVFADGFAAAEAEFLLHVPGSSSGKVPATNDEAKALVDAVRLGIEVASSPYAGINGDGPCVTVSDYGNNGGLVMGPALADWRDIDLCAVPVRTEIDGQIVGEASAATMLDGPYGAVRFLLAHLATRGIGWEDGIWVSTGAVTGVHEIRPDQSAVATFGDLGSIACRIAALA